jgi:predicted dehydrogenase
VKSDKESHVPLGKKQSRRDFLKTSAAVAASGTVPFWFATGTNRAAAFATPNERPVVGCIGCGSQWQGYDGKHAVEYFDCAAICDVDTEHLGQGREKLAKWKGGKGRDAKVDMYGDYRKILDRKDIDVVTIVVPDHWHAKIAIEAMKAGKDVYCEKPLTLTIDEGKQIIKVLKETKRVFQVGTQQRSEMHLNFLNAVAMVHDGRIGKVLRATCDIGAPSASGPLKKTAPPPNLNWEMWQGQTPVVDYIERRCHYEFRWWYEYSGGKLTDWGAHHVDIAQWAIGMDHSGPVTVEPLHVKHPNPLKHGYPTVDNEYNTALEFKVRCVFPNNVELLIVHDSPEARALVAESKRRLKSKSKADGNGVLFEGSEGTFHVGRSVESLCGKPVDELKSKPISEDLITRLYKGKTPGHHMGNFAECVKTREDPISDVYTHHRAVTTCHLANISLRLGRSLTWDPQTEQIVGDKEAASWLSREQRKGYEIHA